MRHKPQQQQHDLMQNTNEKVIIFIPGQSDTAKFNLSGKQSMDELIKQGYSIFSVSTDQSDAIGLHPITEEHNSALNNRDSEINDSALYPPCTADSWNNLLVWKKVTGPLPGLRNLGNTCFMNAVLQCLLYLPCFSQLCNLDENDLYSASKIVKTAREKSRDLGYENRYCALATIVSLGKLMQKQSTHAVLKKHVPVSPIKLLQNLNKISHSLMRVGRQQDAHEFLRMLIDAAQSSCAVAAGLHENSMDPILETSFIFRLFGGHLESRIACGSPTCTYISTKIDSFLDLSLDVANSEIKSIEDALKSYLADENLQLDSEWKCGTCGKVSHATRSSRIIDAPVHLILHMKIFSYSTHGKKISRTLNFGEALDLSPFLKDGTVYDLSGIVVHLGRSIDSGHYLAYVKNSNGFWYQVEDDNVKHVTKAVVLSQAPYLLFYSRRAMSTPSKNGNAASDDEDTNENDMLAAFASQYENCVTMHSERGANEVRDDLFGTFLQNEEPQPSIDKDIPRVRVSSQTWLGPAFGLAPMRQSRHRAQDLIRSLTRHARELHVRMSLIAEMAADHHRDNDDSVAIETENRLSTEGDAKIFGAGMTPDDPPIQNNSGDTEEVVTIHRRKNPSSSKEWEQSVKRSAKRARSARNTQRPESNLKYDAWDAHLDLGKQKKVKTKMETKDLSSKFQQKQDKTNRLEAKRRGIDGQ